MGAIRRLLAKYRDTQERLIESRRRHGDDFSEYAQGQLAVVEEIVRDLRRLADATD